ncbi:uncharacterized protein BX664DRAFT_276374 [Halteromyces radiatus]|uniref:uncharacterized protein n=1 Tax=Halteromyces radiatus TaxID=101107 RepID=UPI00221E885B|nr:uncharacterized protein BX664DRAFT_276374 [Halteromyces radiatus]KAI8097567.1 hypothetical protein BX664DRAFT_276374 [Halteromyces radiatus]
MNLYVKNMDPLITNEHLHALFGKFGRIISARVISHPITKMSRGYGFVSFSREDEAAHALHEMNGQMVFSKPLYVSYHEPKKGRNDNNTNGAAQQQLQHLKNQLSQPALNGYINDHQENNRRDPVPSAPYQNQQQQHISPPIINLPRKQELLQENVHPSTAMIEEINPYRNNTTVKLPRRKSFAAEAPVVKTSPIFATSSPNMGAPSLVSLATGMSIQPAPDSFNQQQSTIQQYSSNNKDLIRNHTNNNLTLRRRGSIESVSTTLTESSSFIQRQKLTNAVLRCTQCSSERASDIVDLLLTLNRKERSLCLFNSDFLKEKIGLALDALDAFEDDDDLQNDSDEDINSAVNEPDIWEPQQFPPTAASPLPCVSKAIPIIAPTSLSNTTNVKSNNINDSGKSNKNNNINNSHLPVTPPSSLSTSDLNSGRMSPKDIDTFLDSISTLSIYSQKQKLGNMMWNYVKPLAKLLAKHHKVPGFSSKILIHLLDNVPLDELAHGINNTKWLKTKVEEAAKCVHD